MESVLAGLEAESFGLALEADGVSCCVVFCESGFAAWLFEELELGFSELGEADLPCWLEAGLFLSAEVCGSNWREVLSLGFGFESLVLLAGGG